MELKFSRHFSKNKCTFPWKSVPWAEMFHAEGRTDMTTPTDAFRNFGNESNNPQDWKLNLPNTKQECHPPDRVVRFYSKTQEWKQVDATLRTGLRDRLSQRRNTSAVSTMQPVHFVFRCSEARLSSPDACRRCKQLCRTVFRTCFSHLTLTVQRSRHLARDHITC